MGARFAASGLAFFLVLGAAAAASGTSWGSFPTSATVEVWCAPSKPPAAPTYSATVPGFPTTIARLGPALPGCSPLTQGEIIVDGRLLIGCFSETTVMARGGDIVDSPVLLPLVTAILRCDRERDGLRYSNGPQHGDLHRHLVRLGRRSAARLEWFEGGILLNSLTRTGPWSETIMVNITSVGAIETVEVLGSTVAVSLPAAVPARGTPATIALALLLAGSGLAMCVSLDRANELRS